MESNSISPPINNFDKIVDLIIRLGVLFLLIGWCLDIIKPFLTITIWSTVIAVAIYPLHCSFIKFFKGKNVLSIIVLIAILLSFIMVPSVLVTYSMYEGMVSLKQIYTEGQPLIPPPGELVRNWPSFTEPIVTLWKSASNDLNDFAFKHSYHFKIAGAWFLSILGGVGRGILELNISIIVAGVLLAYADSLTLISKKIFVKLAGKNGEHFASISVSTIRNVSKGFLGVALIQSALAGIAFFIAGVPFAGILTVICLILAIIQIGVGPIAIPVTIYMFSVLNYTNSIILAIWIGFVLISDNILKPILLGKGASADTPMLVVFIGAVGGLLYDGFVGLFLGSVILTIGYKLFISWINSDN